jgi:DNA-binding response OmpR family regulator
VKANLAQYARVKSGGKTAASAANEITAGNITIHTQTRRVLSSGAEIELTNKEYEMFLFLTSNPDIIFSREHIYNQIWGEDMYGDLSTVTVHIKRLREKIERNPANPVNIQTVWGVGYRFKI